MFKSESRFLLRLKDLSFRDRAEARGWGAHSPPSLWFVAQRVRVRQEEMGPQSHPPTPPRRGEGVRAAESLADRCWPVRIEQQARGEGGIGLAPECQLEREQLWRRKEAALQLGVHVGRGAEPSRQQEVLGAPRVSAARRPQAEGRKGLWGLGMRSSGFLPTSGFSVLL